jgi:nicotinamide phosphoribosyltransferase
MENDEYRVNTQCTQEQEQTGLLQTIFEDGKFYNQISLTEIRSKINEL